MFKSLTRDEAEKIHGIFPNATFSIVWYISASSSSYGANYGYDDVASMMDKHPITEWVIQDIEGLGPFPVVKRLPSISVQVVDFSGGK